jgi:hypothetical protein
MKCSYWLWGSRTDFRFRESIDANPGLRNLKMRYAGEINSSPSPGGSVMSQAATSGVPIGTSQDRGR